MIKSAALTLLLLGCPLIGFSQVRILKSTISTTGSAQRLNQRYMLSHTIAQPSSVALASNHQHALLQGFEHPSFWTSTVPAPLASDVQLYPNPGSGTFTLRSPHFINLPCHVQVHDLQGKAILNFEFTPADDGTIGVDLTSHASGTYQVRIQTPVGSFVKWAIIQKKK